MSETENTGNDPGSNELGNSTPDQGIVVIEGRPYKRLHPAVYALGGLGILVVAMLLIWLFWGRGQGDAGRPVSAPRSSFDEPPADMPVNQTLTISAEQFKNAGITIETVGEQMSAESTATSAAGTVEANAYRQTPAVSVSGGIVRRVMPELGSFVSAGQTVAVIYSDEFAQTQSRYLTLLTETDNARRSYDRAQRLAVINQPGRSELEQATRQRRAAEAALNEMRNRYDRTTRLIRIGAASREELDQDTTKLRTAEAELEEARLREQRSQQLLPISPEVRAGAEEALNKLRSAETELASTRQRLILFGMSSAQVSALRSADQIRSEFAVPAPISGVVTSRNVNAGEVVEANKELLRITDLSTVWVIAQIYEADLARMRTGSGGTITSDAVPNRVFRGQVTYIDPQFDTTTRTAKIRLEVPNDGQALKIGMYVRVALAAHGTAERTTPVIPKDAVQNIMGRQMVFVATGDPNVFELRPVRTGTESDGRYQVLEGLQVGDNIVVNGSFTLRAEWLKTQQGTEHPH